MIEVEKARRALADYINELQKMPPPTTAYDKELMRLRLALVEEKQNTIIAAEMYHEAKAELEQLKSKDESNA